MFDWQTFGHSIRRAVFSGSAVINAIGVGLVAVLVLLMTTDVILRRFFNSPITGSYELVCRILILVVFFTLAYCAVRKQHVVIDLLVSRFPQRVQAAIDSFTSLLSLGICGLLTWRLVVLAIHLMQVHETVPMVGIPQYPFPLLAAIGSALLTLVILIQLIQSLTGMVRR